MVWFLTFSKRQWDLSNSNSFFYFWITNVFKYFQMEQQSRHQLQWCQRPVERWKIDRNLCLLLSYKENLLISSNFVKFIFLYEKLIKYFRIYCSIMCTRYLFYTTIIHNPWFSSSTLREVVDLKCYWCKQYVSPKLIGFNCDTELSSYEYSSFEIYY